MLQELQGTGYRAYRQDFALLQPVDVTGDTGNRLQGLQARFCLITTCRCYRSYREQVSGVTGVIGEILPYYSL